MFCVYRLYLISTICCIGLSACAGATPVPTTTPLLIETLVPSPIPTETLIPTLTPEPTAMEAPYNVDVETAKQKAIIENASNNIQEFSYLQSEEYFQGLKDKNARGEFPQISPNAICVQPGMIDLQFDKEPSKLFLKYGISSAIKISPIITYKWQIRENRCWALVDAGYTETGEGFFVVKWKNQDKTEEFWGYTFIPTGVRSETDEFKNAFDLNGAGYPVPAMFTSVKGCQKYIFSFSTTNVADYCKTLGVNPESAIPKVALHQWNETGKLELNFLPWSHPGTTPFK